jgi:hypothetical protein
VENPPAVQEVQHRTRYAVTPEEFALTWNDSESADEAAERLKMPKPIVLARVSAYRNKGVKLKKMRRANSRLDVEKLNNIIRSENSFVLERQSPKVETPLVIVALSEGTGTQRPRSAITLRIHLLDGTADGLRIIERASSTVQALACPRHRLRGVKSRPEFQKLGVYLLIGAPDASGRQSVYIGEGDAVLPRLEQHNLKKSFWTSLLLFVTKDDGLHKAHGQFLESRLTALAKASGRCKLMNANTPLPPTLSEADLTEGEAFLDEVLLLSRLLGLSFFQGAAIDQHKSGDLTGQGESDEQGKHRDDRENSLSPATQPELLQGGGHA